MLWQTRGTSGKTIFAVSVFTASSLKIAFILRLDVHRERAT